jgi:hypothetical protein
MHAALAKKPTTAFMKIHLPLLLATCVIRTASMAEEVPPQKPGPILEAPTPAPVVEPVKPAAAPPAASGGIPFNAENKQTAKKIYGLINEVQRTGFDPQKNFSLIAELQRVVAGTNFSNFQAIQGYIRASLNLNSLRSRDSKAEQGNTGSQETINQKNHGFKADASFSGPVLGGDLTSADSTKVGGAHTSGVTISSQAAFAELGPAMQQQSAAYGKLLEELNSSGFPEPILSSELYGKWKWHCGAVAATYEFELQEDGALYAEVIADDPSTTTPNHATANKGRGEWKLDYRSLTLELHGAKLAVFWKQSPQTFLAGKQIKSIDEEEIILDTPEDNLLKKVRSPRRK